MTLAPVPSTDAPLTPEEVAAHDTLPREEKLNRLNDMKFELERQTGRGTASLDQVEQRMASINLAFHRIRRP